MSLQKLFRVEYYTIFGDLGAFTQIRIDYKTENQSGIKRQSPVYSWLLYCFGTTLGTTKDGGVGENSKLQLLPAYILLSYLVSRCRLSILRLQPCPKINWHMHGVRLTPYHWRPFIYSLSYLNNIRALHFKNTSTHLRSRVGGFFVKILPDVISFD